VAFDARNDSFQDWFKIRINSLTQHARPHFSLITNLYKFFFLWFVCIPYSKDLVFSNFLFVCDSGVSGGVTIDFFRLIFLYFNINFNSDTYVNIFSKKKSRAQQFAEDDNSRQVLFSFVHGYVLTFPKRIRY